MVNETVNYPWDLPDWMVGGLFAFITVCGMYLIRKKLGILVEYGLLECRLLNSGLAVFKLIILLICYRDSFPFSLAFGPVLR